MNDIKLFPNYEQVFSNGAGESAELMFPVLSVKLSSVSGGLGSDYIHLVQFNEDPYNTDTVKYFTDYCTDRMISFSLNNGLYEFGTSLRYFDLTEDWEEYLEKTKVSYLTAKARFEHGEKVIDEDWYKVGGKPEWLQDDETPSDPDGNPMTFIAQFDTLYLFDDGCPKTIYLFYSKEHKLAVELYQIT
jgi:Domain of unknown function (DUF1963)